MLSALGGGRDVNNHCPRWPWHASQRFDKRPLKNRRHCLQPRLFFRKLVV